MQDSDITQPFTNITVILRIIKALSTIVLPLHTGKEPLSKHLREQQKSGKRLIENLSTLGVHHSKAGR